MTMLNLGLCFLTLLAIAFTIRFNDEFAVQKVTRISYRVFKLACALCIGAYALSLLTQALSWAVVPIAIIATLAVCLLVHDAKHGEKQRAFADEHPRRPALGNTTMRFLYAIAAALIAYGISQLQLLS